MNLSSKLRHFLVFDSCEAAGDAGWSPRCIAVFVAGILADSLPFLPATPLRALPDRRMAGIFQAAGDALLVVCHTYGFAVFAAISDRDLPYCHSGQNFSDVVTRDTSCRYCRKHCRHCRKSLAELPLVG